MPFKDIKQNYPVYILDKNELELIQGKALSVSFPRLQVNPNTGKTEMVVDISISAKDNVATYAIPENSSITYAGDLVLATDKSQLVSEIEAMKNAAEQVLSSVDHQRKVLDTSTKLLSELNPVFKEKQETEQRFSNIESNVNELKSMILDLIKKLE